MSAAEAIINVPRVSDRLLTCGACDRILPADDEGFLPNHVRVLEMENGDPLPLICVGSHTKGHPHRMLPPAPSVPDFGARGFTYLDIQPDDDEGKRGANRDIAAIAVCAKFLCDWLGPLKMRIDEVQMAKIVAHTTRARQAALNLSRNDG